MFNKGKKRIERKEDIEILERGIRETLSIPLSTSMEER